MRTRLLYRDRDVRALPALPENADDLIRDLDLDALVAVMADDARHRDVVRRIMLVGADDVDDIVHRQDVLRDCIATPDAVAEIHGIAQDALDRERRTFLGILSKASPARQMYHSVGVLKLYTAALADLRDCCIRHEGQFRSAGLRSLCSRMATEFDESYVKSVEGYLDSLRFPKGSRSAPASVPRTTAPTTTSGATGVLRSATTSRCSSTPR
ncbi:hypothetical protein [Tsukamurella soli]|uniref:hypothetical protein n=1 Tax=Tsukamurella soli TaxID=644556 RepID=UPI00360E295C